MSDSSHREELVNWGNQREPAGVGEPAKSPCDQGETSRDASVGSGLHDAVMPEPDGFAGDATDGSEQPIEAHEGVWGNGWAHGGVRRSWRD
jgi:hypothetical protein